MCLGVPAKIVEIRPGQMAWAEVEGNRTEISLRLVPEAQAGQFVLVHAGFAMDIIDADYAAETMFYLKELEQYAEA